MIKKDKEQKIKEDKSREKEGQATRDLIDDQSSPYITFSSWEKYGAEVIEYIRKAYRDIGLKETKK